MRTLSVVLAAFVGGCGFDAALPDHPILLCSAASDCPANGQQCLRGLCVPLATEFPQVEDLAVRTDEDVPASISLAARGVKPADAVFHIVEGPSRGVLHCRDAVEVCATGCTADLESCVVDETLTYIPGPNLSGPDSFRVAVENTAVPARDGGGLTSDPAVVTLDVIPQNDAPALLGTSPTLQVNEDDANLLALFDFVTDPDGDNLGVLVTAQPVHGSVELAAAGVLLFRAEQRDYHGPDAFTVEVDDGTLSLALTVPVTIAPVNDAPTVATATAQLSEGDVTDIAIDVADVDGDPLTVEVLTLPPVGALNVGVGDALPVVDGHATLSYSAPADFNGSSVTFSVAALDASLTSEPASVNVRVLRSLRANPEAVEVQEDTFRDVVLTGQAEGGQPTFLVSRQPVHGTLEVQSADTVRYRPAPDFAGDDTFGFRASASGAESNEANVAIRVTPQNDAPAAASASYGVEQGLPVSIALQGADIDSPNLFAQIVATPSGGTLEAEAGRFAMQDGVATVVYTPRADFSGETTLSYLVFDDASPALSASSPPANVTVTVTKALRADDRAATVAEDGEVTIELTGQAEGVSPTFLVTQQPTHGVLETLSADEVVYRPLPDFNGDDSFSYLAAAAGAQSSPAQVTVTVLPQNDPPSADDGTNEVTQGEPLLVRLGGRDVEDLALTARVLLAPAGGTLSVPAGSTVSMANGEVFITYQPAANFSGDVELSYEVLDADGASSGPAHVTIHVALALRAFPLEATVAEDGVIELELTGQAEGAPPSFPLTALPSHGSLEVLTSSRVRYRPAPNFFGLDTFAFVAAAPSEQSTPATVSITVTSQNDLPSSSDGVATVVQGESVTLTLGGNDVEASDLSALIVSAPGESVGALPVLPGDVVPLPGGSAQLLFTASETFAGPAVLTYLVVDPDGGQSSFANIAITVLPALLAFSPTDAVELPEDQSAVISLEGQGAGDLSFVITSAPLHGQIEIIDAHNVRYRPVPNYFGDDTFGFVAQSADAASPEAFVAITVVPIEDAPVFVGATASTQEEQSLNLPLNCTDVDGDALSFTADPLRSPTFGTVSISGATATYAPQTNRFGIDAFDLLCSDGVVATPARFQVTVSNQPDAPVALPPPLVRTSEDRSTIVVLSGADADGDALVFAIGSPAHGTLTEFDAVRGVMLYTPAADFFGDDTFTFTVRDGGLTSAPATVNITVTGANDAPTVVTTVLQQPAHVIDRTFPITITDPDGDTSFSMSIIGAPARGTATVIGGTQVRYRRSNNTAFLDDSLTLRVSDAGGASTTVVVRVEITGRSSCALALNNGESLGNAVHVIDPDPAGGADRFLAFCDQTTAGGGWTLALRADARSSNFEFASTRWTDTSTLNSDLPGFPDNREAKLQSFNAVAVTELLVGLAPIINNGLTVSSDRRFMVAQLQGVARDSLRAALVTNTTISLVTGTNPSVQGRNRWLRLLGGASPLPILQPNCNQEALRAGIPVTTAVRIGIVGNNENDCNSPDSYLGIGATLTGAAPFRDVVVGNRVLTVPQSSSPAVGFVFVRSRDFTSAGSRASCVAHATAGARISGTYLVNNAPTTCSFGGVFLCGDGFADAPEECDDGNTNNADGCDSLCQIPVCGNGRLDGVEACDDGNTSNFDLCTAACRPASCGDGFPQAVNGEACDDGNADSDDNCTVQCRFPACGDGILQPNHGEECDDGNFDDSDGCAANCVYEPCIPLTEQHTFCLDFASFAQASERCANDGAVLATIGNAAEGFTVLGGVSDLLGGTTSYWIGLTDAVEEGRFQWLDGGVGATLRFGAGEPNNVNEEDCVQEQGDGFWNDVPCDSGLQYVCEFPTCGDGAIQGNEECDDANSEPLDGCSTVCTVNRCNDGLFDPGSGEECDDGNLEPFDGCSTRCSFVCGDGAVSGFEECDDGNRDGGDGCSPECGFETPPLECFDIGDGYSFCNSAMSWFEAASACESIGMVLPSPTQEGVMDHLRDVVGNAIGVANYWLGLTDLGDEGNFVWVNGEPLQYSNFDDAQPDNADGIENCVEELESKRWNDLPCDGPQRSVVCQATGG